MPGKSGIINRNCFLLQSFKKSVNILPVNMNAIFIKHIFSIFTEVFIIHGKRRGTAITCNFSCYTLHYLTFSISIHKKFKISMGMDINKSRSSHHVFSINN